MDAPPRETGTPSASAPARAADPGSQIDPNENPSSPLADTAPAPAADAGQGRKGGQWTFEGIREALLGFPEHADAPTVRMVRNGSLARQAAKFAKLDATSEELSAWIRHSADQPGLLSTRPDGRRRWTFPVCAVFADFDAAQAWVVAKRARDAERRARRDGTKQLAEEQEARARFARSRAARAARARGGQEPASSGAQEVDGDLPRREQFASLDLPPGCPRATSFMERETVPPGTEKLLTPAETAALAATLAGVKPRGTSPYAAPRPARTPPGGRVPPPWQKP